ncbi:MAG: amidohydrolase family protein [Halieaceae bacterium]|jgi:cytosine/adenosine deaminase-related metal-dependent hydrolase|nr:amidohydrolase family protein [Halieaceae bacterium]
MYKSIFTLFLLTLLVGSGAHAATALINARIMTLDSREATSPIDGYLLIGDDGRIASLGAGPFPSNLRADTVVDVDGGFVLPGFVSAHSHLWQSALRGLAANETLFGWAEAIYDQHARYAEPVDLYWFTLHGALDHLRNGITTAYNFNVSTNDVLASSRRQLDAEMESGLRFVHGFSIGRDQPYETAREQLATFIELTETRTPARMVSVMINGGGAFREEKTTALIEGELMRTFGIGNHQHYLEAPDQKYVMQDKYAWFREADSIGPGMLWGHFIHTTPEILRETADSGASMSWNPLSNGRLASGTPDIPMYLAMGIPVGMGVDGQASADLADPLANARTGLYAIRAMYQSAAIMGAYDVLWLHTMGGAQVLGVADEVGSLAPGKQADIVVYQPKKWDVAPITDPYATLVFAMDSRHLSQVYVAGELLFNDGKLTGHDFDAVASEVGAHFDAVVERREAALAQ